MIVCTCNIISMDTLKPGLLLASKYFDWQIQILSDSTLQKYSFEGATNFQVNKIQMMFDVFPV